MQLFCVDSLRFEVVPVTMPLEVYVKFTLISSISHL